MKAGKDVYVEKPMVQKIEDGHRMIEAQKATGRIVQVGSQYYESMLYAKARELMKEGAIGQLNMVEAWWDRNSAQGRVGVLDGSQCVAREHRLGPLHRTGAAACLRCRAPLPLAELSGLRHRHPGRSLRAPVHNPPLRHRLSGTDARVRHRRPAVLEGWARRARRGAGTVRLSGVERTAGLQFAAARQLRQWIGRNLRLPFRRQRGHHQLSATA